MADEHLIPTPPQPALSPEATAPADGQPPAAAPADAITPQMDAAPPQADAAPPPAPAPVATSTPQPPPKPPAEPKDVYREVAETIVFVVVLVLLLKTFIAEAFVIPTGSMATTLWGYQKYVDCPNCGFPFPVNCSTESDPQTERPRLVTSCECPNCRYAINLLGEVAGKSVVLLGDSLVVEYTIWKIGLPWWERRQAKFIADNQTVIRVNGKPGRLEEIVPDMPVRVVFDKQKETALSIDAAADGNFPPLDKMLAIDPGSHSGDRVLVFKSLYDTGLRSPHRHDVVVFKFPVEPQVNHTPMNYIKRLIGLPGETIAIAQGQLYVYDKPRDMPEPGNDMYWARSKLDQYPWPDNPTDKAGVDTRKALWDKAEFKIVRKSPDLILALRRIVYDNDYQPADANAYPVRWTGEGWTGDAPRPRQFDHTGDASKLHWLRYQHVAKGDSKPELISDYMGYNSNEPLSAGSNWVGDLMLEAEVQVQKAEGELRLELSRGVDRFQARFNLQSGECTLVRLSWTEPPTNAKEPPEGGKETELARKAGVLKGPGKYQLRFANFDEQLTLWVNDHLPFGNGVAYPAVAPGLAGPTANDLFPASIGSQGGALHVSHLRLWRDTYYTARVSNGGDVSLGSDAWSDPTKWGELRTLHPKFMYVQPGHYLCLGDNSPASADSRSWGMVPERLMLGRALVVYFPFYFPYWPINSPTNRVGAIR
jgi:signal peptidase I